MAHSGSSSLKVAASLWTAFGIVAIFGVFFPLRFVPILLMQVTYKIIWLAWIMVGVDKIPSHAVTFIVIFVIFVVGDIIALSRLSIYYWVKRE